MGAGMKPAPPLLTVFMPAYNAAPYLGEAVESVLGQSHADFEFLAVDDGSTDATPRLLRAYARRDRRMRVLRHARNLGLSATFAHGYAEARGRYVARMDSDDVCEPRRLEFQLRRLREDTGPAVLGTWLRLIGQKSGVLHLPWLHEDILCESIFQNPLAHPSVMLDRERMGGLPDFRRAYQPADDYDLWSRCLRRGLRFEALPQPLLRYRMHAAQASRGRAMEAGAWRVRSDWLKAMKLKASRAEAVLHQRLCLGLGSAQEAAETKAWSGRLERAGVAYGLPRGPWLRRLRSVRAQALPALPKGLGRRVLARVSGGGPVWRWELRRAASLWGGRP
jgi:glycosyltransferase involved in cell wall biosynthesis